MTITQEIITRMYEQDKASALAIAMMYACIESSKTPITPDDILEFHEKLNPLAKKLAEQIDAGIKTVKLSNTNDMLSSPKAIASTNPWIISGSSSGTSGSTSFPRTSSGSFLRKTDKKSSGSA